MPCEPTLHFVYPQGHTHRTKPSASFLRHEDTKRPKKDSVTLWLLSYGFYYLHAAFEGLFIEGKQIPLFPFEHRLQLFQNKMGREYFFNRDRKSTRLNS